MNNKPILYIVIPCYNEEQVLPQTAPMFRVILQRLIQTEKINDRSRILFVDDGSHDRTWELISSYAAADCHFEGIRQSRNRGHQNAVLAGLFEARAVADAAVTIDCDGQDDIDAIERMTDEFLAGSDIVYGVRSDRKQDTFFKRKTAECYYKLLAKMGVDVIYNHADFRLVSRRVLDALTEYHETNLFLRGIFPTIGFKTATVEYERHQRLAGESHYPLAKMFALAADGIVGFSVKPLRLIITFGIIGFVLNLIGMIAFLIAWLGCGFSAVPTVLFSVFSACSILLIAVGIVGEYVGRMMTEIKARPRFIISDRTNDKGENNGDTH